MAEGRPRVRKRWTNEIRAGSTRRGRILGVSCEGKKERGTFFASAVCYGRSHLPWDHLIRLVRCEAWSELTMEVQNSPRKTFIQSHCLSPRSQNNLSLFEAQSHFATCFQILWSFLIGQNQGPDVSAFGSGCMAGLVIFFHISAGRITPRGLLRLAYFLFWDWSTQKAPSG